eukprot:366101-Chlamydomonas_euryale.AAC.17
MTTTRARAGSRRTSSPSASRRYQLHGRCSGSQELALLTLVQLSRGRLHAKRHASMGPLMYMHAQGCNRDMVVLRAFSADRMYHTSTVVV